MQEKNTCTTEMNIFVSECWTTILTNIQGTVVYIDHSANECLHWYTAGKGYLTLKDAGAVAVHELDMYHFQYVQVKGTKKATIISVSSDPAFYQRTMKMILEKNTFDNCTVYCGVPSSTTAYFKNMAAEERLNYVKLKEDIKSWMCQKNLSTEPLVNIIHVPLCIALLNEHLFVTPPCGNLMPPLDGNIAKDILNELNVLASSFCELFDSLNATADIFSIGQLSDRLAEYLDTANSDRRNHSSDGSETSRLSLVLMDRTLDLCTPTSNSTESFLAKILRTFPRLPHHNNDVAINMSSAVFGTVEGLSCAYKVPGCLASIEKTTMDLFVSKKEKDLLTMASQSLNDMLSVKKSKTPTRISGHSLEKVLSKVQNVSTTIGMEKVQGILTIVGASTSQKTGQLELLTSLEKLTLQNLSVSRESSSILAQLSNVIRTRIQRGLDMENLLALLVHVYALAGTQIRFSLQQEHQLEKSIADAVFEDFQILKENPSTVTTTYHRTLLLGTNDITIAREASYRIAARIVDTLRSVAEQRSALHDYRFCMIKPSNEDRIRYVGVFEQIARDIVCKSVTGELRDLCQKSSSLISSGFNLLLRGKTKRHPRDNQWIIIYIIGGVTAEEAKIIQEIPSNYEGAPYITLGGSRLLNPLGIVEKILFC